MNPINIYNNFKIDDLSLIKSLAVNKIKQVIDFAENIPSKGFNKFASSNIDNNALINLFAAMLRQLDLNTNGINKDQINGLIQNLSASANANGLEKTSAIKNSERKDDIKIVSKSIKDSHYQIDISKDVIVHKGKRVFMVSCYARDAYLGRYLIKRNYFYTMEREAAADMAYDEIHLKMKALKDRYYNEIIDVPSISHQAKVILDGVISEIDFKEDSLGTTVNR